MLSVPGLIGLGIVFTSFPRRLYHSTTDRTTAAHPGGFFVGGERVADTVKIKITGEGFEETQAKVDALNEKLAEAKELAAELASALEALRLDFK